MRLVLLLKKLFTWFGRNGGCCNQTFLAYHHQNWNVSKQYIIRLFLAKIRIFYTPATFYVHTLSVQTLNTPINYVKCTSAKFIRSTLKHPVISLLVTNILIIALIRHFTLSRLRKIISQVEIGSRSLFYL